MKAGLANRIIVHVQKPFYAVSVSAFYILVWKELHKKELHVFSHL